MCGSRLDIQTYMANVLAPYARERLESKFCCLCLFSRPEFRHRQDHDPMAVGGMHEYPVAGLRQDNCTEEQETPHATTMEQILCHPV